MKMNGYLNRITVKVSESYKKITRTTKLFVFLLETKTSREWSVLLSFLNLVVAIRGAYYILHWENWDDEEKKHER